MLHQLVATVAWSARRLRRAVARPIPKYGWPGPAAGRRHLAPRWTPAQQVAPLSRKHTAVDGAIAAPGSIVRLLTACVLVTEIMAQLAAAQGASARPPRAKRPDWSSTPGTEVFFDDAFAEALRGTPPAAESVAATVSAATSANWSPWLPAEIIEDEVKSLYRELLHTVHTRAEYRRTDPRSIQRNLAMLAAWFAVIEEYDAEIRWKSSASAARQRFIAFVARSPESFANAYDEVVSAVADLQELLSGGQLSQEDTAEPTTWPQVANRALIMQRWDTAASERLASSLANAAAFDRASDAIRHEAGVLSGLAEVLLQDGMDEAREEEYRGFVRGLQQAASRLTEATVERDFAKAEAAHIDVHRACDQCHETYR